MINQKAHDRLIKSRSKLMKGHVGMASMLLHLDLIEVSSSQCGTMATDGKRIIYNPDFVLEVEEDELRSVLIHEALHVVYEHPLRRGKRHPKVWNISCDYAINGLLIYDLGMELPEGGLWSREYQGKSSEAIYSELMKSEESLQEAIDSMGEGNEGNSETEGGDDEQSNTGKYFAPSDVKTGEQVGEIDLDSIPMPTGEVWDAQDEGKPLSDSAITELKGEIQRAVSLADKLEKAMSTEGTSSMSNRIDQLKDVKVNWKDELNDFLQSSVANENSWARLNRRHSWRGINLPSKAKSPQGGELAVAIDMSGSVSQYELNMFATEIQAMAEDCGLEKIRVCYCDTTVRKNEQGEWWDIYELDQGDELVLRARGGGGTRFDPPFNLFNDYSDDVEDVQAFIYFTDGWGDVSADVEPSIPVIWCVTEESYYAERLPFGEVIYVDTSTLY
tara:strand:+ start:1895 stop:3229 length:1335 start_codon:yes stop_codon:yes gene_type:complete